MGRQSVLNEYPGRPAADSVENVASRHRSSPQPDKFSENVTSSDVSVAVPDRFHDARLFVCVCGEEFEAADFGLLRLFPASDERLQPKWCTESKTFGSNAHCPMDRKLLSEKSKHIAPGDDSWMVRLLRRRLERDGETLPRLFNNRKTGHQKGHQFFDDWLPDSPLVVVHLDGSKSRVPLTIPTAKRFKGLLKDASAGWMYVDADERIGRWHGLTKWINRQDKPVPGQEEIILFGQEYKNLHPEEAQQVKRSHELKSKRNTGGAQPESAKEAPDDFRQWMLDTGAAQEKSGEESEKEFSDRLRELRRIGEPTSSFAEPAGPMSGMVWDGDSFVLEDQPEYFEGRVIPERIRLTAAERAAAFNEHKTLVEAGAVDLREDELILEVKLEYRTREEVAEELGVSVDALDKRIQRRDLEARAMQDGKFQIPYLALTYEQAADIADNNAVYLQVDLNGWRWCKLDVETHGTDQAIEALKVEKLSEALRQRPEYKAAGRQGTNERYPEWTVALKEVKDRFDKQVFHPDRIRIAQRPPRSKQPWEGLLSGE